MSDIDTETLERYERELIQRPTNYGRHIDYGQYDTHAPVFAVATNADDVLAESNWHAMLDIVNGAITHSNREGFNDVHDLGESHWGFGPLDVIYVRVRDECTGRFTPAWIAAVEALESLQEYSVLDDSDFSDREYKRWESIMDDALDTAARDHEDSDTERQAFYRLFADRDDLIDECGSPDPDWDRVAKVYDTVRNDHFGWLAVQHWQAIRAERDTPPPGAVPLF